MDNTLFDRLRQLHLPLGDYAIFGSGPLVVRGIIAPCNDLDIVCRGEIWDRVRKLADPVYLQRYDVSVVEMFDRTVTFGIRWGIGAFDIDELIDTAELVEGLPFVLLQHVVRYKQIRASDKDMLHLDALKESTRFQEGSGYL